jgi:succinate-acetate transporter protein
MSTYFYGRRGAGLVAFFLLVQLAVLAVSVSGYEQISIFCTGPATSKLSWLFGGLHLLFLALLVVGALSFVFVRFRAPYVGILCAALALLPVQASFIGQRLMSCDVP